MAVAEEQDGPSLGPSRNREGAAGSHTNYLPPIERDIGGDGSLYPDALNANWSEELPTHSVIEEQATIANPIGVAMYNEPKRDDADLLFRVHGLYRLLDLISEQGSGGAGMIKAP